MKMQDLENLTIAAVAPDIERRKISPVELTNLFLARIERLNPVLNAYVTITAENALAQAQRAEDEIAQGNYRARSTVFHSPSKTTLRLMGLGPLRDRRCSTIGFLTSTLLSSPS